MYRDERYAMQLVYAGRVRRRTGQEQLPSRDILTAEYETQQRNTQGVRNIIENDTKVIADVDALIKEARAEAIDLLKTHSRPGPAFTAAQRANGARQARSHA